MKVQVDAERLKDVQKQLGNFSHKAPDVITNALNRAMVSMATLLPREIQKEYHVKNATLKDTIRRNKASRARLVAEVKSSGKVIGLNHFKVTPKTVQPRRKKQIKIAVSKKNGMKQIMGAFVANANGIKVFKREGKKRLPIGRLFGPSVLQMADEENIVEAVNKKGYIEFEKRMNAEVNRVLRRVGV